MSSPAAEEAADVQAAEEEQEELGEKGHWGGGGRVSAGAAATAEEDGVEATPLAGLPTCCVCMEPWTCNDAHRICRIPCGHIYGRSCLETWLYRCGNSSAKCLQCGEPFALYSIINLYAPGNLWDGCCRIQELKALVKSELAKSHGQHDEQLKRFAAVNSELAEMRTRHAKLLARQDELVVVCEELQAVRDEEAKRMAQLESTNAKLFEDAIHEAQNVVAEQMKRLVGKNATPMDLIRSMEQNCPKLWDMIQPPPADG